LSFLKLGTLPSSLQNSITPFIRNHNQKAGLNVTHKTANRRADRLQTQTCSRFWLASPSRFVLVRSYFFCKCANRFFVCLFVFCCI